MKTRLYLLLTTIVVMALTLAACSPAATTSPVAPVAPTTAATMAVATMPVATMAATGTMAATTAMTATSGATMAAATATTGATAAVTDTPAATQAGSSMGATNASIMPDMKADPSATGKIALLLPENKTARYEAADKPYFQERLTQLCPKCTVIYSNAGQDANTQLSQAEAALTNGAQVLVLDPVDSKSAASIADKAKAQGVPVVSYDRMVLNTKAVSFYISFDNKKVGQLQAQALIDALTKMNIAKPTIVVINGAPTDANAALFKAGAHSVFDPLIAAGKLTIAKEYDDPDWSPNNAQTEMQQALTALSNKVDGVYCANDGTASGAIAAMKAAGVKPIPPVTGQDAELAGIQRILAGTQYMTIYKAYKPEAYSAAELAFGLLTKMDLTAATKGTTVNNNMMDVPSVLLVPIAVTKDNIQTTVVSDKLYTAAQICTTDYASACTAAGVK